MVILRFVVNYGSTILLCVVLMWLVMNWRDAVASSKVCKSMLDWSDRWKEVIDKRSDRDHDLVKGVFESLDKARLEATKLHEELRIWRSQNEQLSDWNSRSVTENDDLRTELYESRKALWIERNGPLGNDDVLF
jgi:hypothetical protein